MSGAPPARPAPGSRPPGPRVARVAPLPPHAAGPEWEWAAPAPSVHGPRPAEREIANTNATVPEGLSRGRRLSSLLPLAALTAASGLGFHRVFNTADLLPVLVVSVVAPMALSVLLSGVFSRKRRPDRPGNPLWPALLLTVVAWLVVVSATLFRHDGGGLPSPPALRAAWSALLDSPHAILTTILPVPGDPALLVLPHAVLWLASFTSAELALRTRAPLLPTLPALLALGFPLALGVDGPGSDLPVVVALVVLTALVALVRARVMPTLRTVAVALPAIGVLAAVAALLGPYLPGLPSPYDPRNTVTPPTDSPTPTSPLDEVAAWMRNGDADLFTVRTSGGGAAASQANYRLAVLDSYDGTTWSSDATLARSGGRVPPQQNVDPGGWQTIKQTITVQSLPGIWLPAADRPTEVSVPASAAAVLSVDPASGVLSISGSGPAADARIAPRTTYTVTSRLPVYDVKRLQYAPAADDPAMTALPRTDAAGQPIPSVNTFTKAATTATAGSSFPYEQAVKLADWLRGNYQFDPTALPGHSYRQLEFFLTSGKRGTSEQFASAFAVMARTLGLPSRVAVGFRPGTDIGGGVRQVRGQDVLAWPEVEFQGIGWVPFYPTPDAATKSGPSVAPAGQPKQRQQVDQQITQQPRPSLPPHRNSNSRPAAPSPTDPLPTWAYAPLAVLLLACLYVAYAAWVPWRRRARRRGHPDPARRVLGAWQQIVDRLTDIGLPPTGAHTAAEVASFGSSRVGGAAGEHLPALAHLVNEVGYAGRDPDPSSAEAAWHHCDAIERVVLRSVPRRERLRRALRPSSFRRRE